MLYSPKDYAGKIIDAIGAIHTGTELASALTKVSGVNCVYKMSVPRFVLWIFMVDMYHMANWMDSKDFPSTESGGEMIETFKTLVPDAMDAEAWFRSKGQWADGEKFVSS